MLEDVRHGIRVLAKSPAFTALAILTLALGIGLNTALFSVINAVLVQPLPYPESGQLVDVSETHKGRSGIHVSNLNLRDWREQNRSLQFLAGYTQAVTSAVGGDIPVRTRIAPVFQDFFAAMQVAPLIGRTFTREDRTPVAVLSYSLWRRAFGADPKISARTLRLDGLSFAIIGVMPPGFDFPAKSDVWIPNEIFPDDSARSGHNYQAIGRLKSGISLAQAQADLDSVSASVRQKDPSDRDFGCKLTLLHESIVGRVRPAFLVLAGAVGFVLLIACVNVANLQLAKSFARGREIALRTALGARRGRIVRQLLTENLLLASLGGSLGLILALWTTDLLRAFVPADIPLSKAIQVDIPVLLFTVAVTLATGILFGLFPAIAAAKADLHEGLKEGSAKSTAGPSGRRLAGVLVTGEIALAMVLLTGAGLVIRSFIALSRVDPGFQTARVWTASLSWPIRGADSEPDPAQVPGIYRRLFDRLRALPGVEAVAAANVLPMQGRGSNGEFAIEGRRQGKGVNTSFYRVISPDYFRTLSIPLVRGRFFTSRDDENSGPVVIVNATMAGRFFPNEDAVGKRIRYDGFGRPKWLTIVGVAADTRDFGLGATFDAECFVPYLQRPGMFVSSDLLVRTTRETDMTAAVAEQVRAVNADVPVTVTRYENVLSGSLSRERFQMQLLSLFAALALVLAGVGIYGVLSYSVDRRMGELGIRMALGAKPAQILRGVLGEGLVLALSGLAIGILGSIALTRTLSSFLFGVTATDPATFAAVAAVVTSVAMLASFVPARRATRVDPAVALRNE
jgi:putative ABC transport system permease protein